MEKMKKNKYGIRAEEGPKDVLIGSILGQEVFVRVKDGLEKKYDFAKFLMSDKDKVEELILENADLKVELWKQKAINRKLSKHSKVCPGKVLRQM